MADASTTFSTLSTDAPNVWISREMYRLAERNLRIGKYAQKYTLPQRFGKTMRIVRYKRMALPTATLTEGTPPDAVALSIENVDVTVEQWGIVVLLTDVAQITTTHPALNIAIERTALAMAEVLEREQCNMLLGGTQVQYPGSVATRDALGANDTLDTATVINVAATLRSRGAMEYEGALFSGVLSPQAEADIVSADQTFKDASNFANVRRLEYGEIGIWMAVRWARSNFMPIFVGIAAPGTQSATVSGYGNEAGAGAGIGGSKVVVVARDANSDYERKISQSKTVTAGKDTADVTTPTSTAYTYDIYLTNTSGAAQKRVFSRVAANTVKGLSSTVYTAGTTATAPVAPATGVEVFVGWVFGKDAFGRVELNGMSLQSYITPAGASYSNPLAQGRKIGSKIMWKSFIIENDFFVRLEAASGFSARLPA